MAKNLLEQLFAFASDTWSGISDQASGPTGVARYLERQARAEREAADEEMMARKTGVERYLERMAEAEVEEEKPELSGVEKYLANQALAEENRPKVVRPKAVESPATPVVKKKPVISGVDKYLDKQESNPPKAPPSVARRTPASDPTVAKVSVSDKKPAKRPTRIVKKVSPKPVQKAPQKAAGIINLSKDSGQCQARTSKGTQCSRTNGLKHIQRTINKQKYQFSACSQHKNDSFKPYQPLIEGS